MNFKRITLLMCLSAIIALSSCKKDDDNNNTAPPVAQTKTQLITTPLWRTTGLTITQGMSTVDVYDDIDSCSADDLSNFLLDGTYVETEGMTKCDPADPDTVFTGSWNFTADELHVILDGDSAEIVSLNSTTLSVRIDVESPGTEPTFLDRTFTAQ